MEGHQEILLQKNADLDLFVGERSVWDETHKKHPTYSDSIKLQICGQHYSCPWSNDHKAKERTNSMQ